MKHSLKIRVQSRKKIYYSKPFWKLFIAFLEQLRMIKFIQKFKLQLFYFATGLSSEGWVTLTLHTITDATLTVQSCVRPVFRRGASECPGSWGERLVIICLWAEVRVTCMPGPGGTRCHPWTAPSTQCCQTGWRSIPRRPPAE